jgi:cytochrome c oxidase assembly protein subunit 11
MVKRNTKIALICTGVVLGMLALALSAAPLYSAFCRVTGFGGTTQTATQASAKILDRTIEVRFDANVGAGAALEFKPEKVSQTLRLGETGLAFFDVTNPTDRPISAIASYNVAPHNSGPFFVKLQCFCFNEQVFEPGKTVRLPVVYFVDPAILDERETRNIRSITLSYTYFNRTQS